MGDVIDVGLIPGLGRSLGKGNGNPLQYSCLENPMDRGAWRATVHGVTRFGHNLVTKPHKAHNHWEKKDVNNIQNVQVDFAVF